MLAGTRRTDADSLALQAMRDQTFEYPGEDLVVDFGWKAASGAAQPRVIRRSRSNRRRNSRSERLSAQRHSRPRSVSMPSKYPISSMQK